MPEKNCLKQNQEKCQFRIYIYFFRIGFLRPEKNIHLVSSREEGGANQVCGVLGFGFVWLFSPHQDCMNDQPDVLSLLFVLFPLNLNPGR